MLGGCWADRRRSYGKIDGLFILTLCCYLGGLEAAGTRREEVIDVNLEAATDHRTRDYPKIFLRNLKKTANNEISYLERQRERENFAMNLNEIN